MNSPEAVGNARRAYSVAMICDGETDIELAPARRGHVRIEILARVGPLPPVNLFTPMDAVDLRDWGA